MSGTQRGMADQWRPMTAARWRFRGGAEDLGEVLEI